MTERYAHTADWAASALNEALSVNADRRRFSFASHGISNAATTKTAIPK
jgi:hypothetical protein